MKLLLDQHLSRKLVPLLQRDFPASSHVALVGLADASDRAVWEYARANDFLIVTKDEDFQLFSFALGMPPKVLWLRTGNAPSRDVLATLIGARELIAAFAADQERSLLVLH